MKFRFVDRILSWTPHASIRGLKTVSFEEYNLRAPLGDEPHLPESLLLESFLQLGNWLFLLSSDFTQMGVPVRLARIQFHEYLLPGQSVEMQVTLSRARANSFELSGAGLVRGRTIISGAGCLAVPVPAADYVNPEDLRVLFSEIYQPETTS